MHPFLAPDFPYAYLLPQLGDTISGLLFLLLSKKTTGEMISRSMKIKHSCLTGFVQVKENLKGHGIFEFHFPESH